MDCCFLVVSLMSWAFIYFHRRIHWKLQLLIVITIIIYVWWRCKNNTWSEFIHQVDHLSKGLPIPSTIKTALRLTKNVADISEPSQLTSNQPHNNKPRRSVTSLQKRYVAAQQQWKCRICHNLLDESYEVDHIIPLFRGGSNQTENLQALCRNCHGKKTVQDVLPE